MSIKIYVKYRIKGNYIFFKMLSEIFEGFVRG